MRYALLDERKHAPQYLARVRDDVDHDLKLADTVACGVHHDAAHVLERIARVMVKGKDGAARGFDDFVRVLRCVQNKLKPQRLGSPVMNCRLGPEPLAAIAERNLDGITPDAQAPRYLPHRPGVHGAEVAEQHW